MAKIKIILIEYLFLGSKVFCLHVYSMTTIEVPLSSPMFQYLERGMLAEARRTAALGGVTEADMVALGTAALEVMDLDVARMAFAKVKQFKIIFN